ncbi:hypothetical protein [Virgisporangium aurantiacum]|uniref:Uncharacterized protein n=1 Tax=Virgisporangium aurantiacum TaxID=175570 RepID=A0A8J3Z6P0_9ACTN|nr:hypothetical protein [Virgisporangium aurantiacum]GIJ58489.1 hypothetical protein Vau01_060050 [Virgisporangium aurantiacum]
MNIHPLLEGVDSYTTLAEVAVATPETEEPQATPTVIASLVGGVTITITYYEGC